MATSTAVPSKPTLDSAQRAWLAKMGAALQAPPTGKTGTSQAGGSAAPQAGKAAADSGGAVTAAKAADSPPDPNAEKFEKETLKVGAKGPAVEHLQKLLKDNGAAVEVDGKFGPATEKAVKEFQKAKTLTPDGIVGQKTWGALKAGKPAPPPPPDTKPRRVILLVTDAASNDAVEDAVVKIGEQTEKTGNTGQATFSLPPGEFVFGVTADGFEQAADKFEVKSSDESQIRVELKAGDLSTQVVLTVEPRDQSNKGDKLKLTATVTASNGKPATSGTVRFDVVSNGTARLTLATIPVKDGIAVHTETKLPKGSHILDVTFTPNAAPFQPAQSTPVKHEVQQDENGEDKEIAKRLIDKINAGDAQEIQDEIAKLNSPRRSMRRLLNIMTLIQKAGKSEGLLDNLRSDLPDNVRIAVAVFTAQRRFTRQWFKLYEGLNSLDKKAVLARTPPKVIVDFELQNDPADPPDPNAEPDDANAKIVIDSAISTKATIEFHSKLMGVVRPPEFEIKIGPNGKLKTIALDLELVKTRLQNTSGLGPDLDLEGKLSLETEVEFKKHEKVIVKEVQGAVKAQVEIKFPGVKVLKKVKFTLGVKFGTDGEFHFEGGISIPIPSL